MTLLVARNSILIIGWPVLVIGGFFIFLQAYRFKKYIERENPFGQLVFILTIAILITMYNLGIIATLAMIIDPEKMIAPVIPIFIVWFLIMAVILIKLRNLDKKAREYNAFLNELNIAKSDFIAIVSHQLRTPLTGIKWILERLLNENKINSDIMDDFKNMYRNNDDMIRMVSNLLSNARIETGQLMVKQEVLEILPVIKSTVERIAINAQMKNQKIVVQNEAIKAVAVIDSVLFTESLKNLLSNALMYGDADSTITVQVTETSTEYIVSVHNFGNPIPEAQQKKLFKKFSRTPDAQHHIAPNTEVGGIGLYVTKIFIQMLGGRVWYSSTAHDGVTFFLGLPRDTTKITQQNVHNLFDLE